VLRPILICICAASLLILSPPASAETRPSETQKAFTAGGRVQMKLSAGEYRIVAGAPDRILVRWSTQRPEDQAKARVQIEVNGRQGTIVTDGPSNKGLDVTIELPARSDLFVRLSAGELSIERIEGSKDIQAHAGELNIDIGRREDYKQVNASVWAGEINAEAFGVNKGGLWRSFDWQGKGPYTLQARLKAGEIGLNSDERTRKVEERRLHELKPRH
jgi:hypothetical protein